MDSDTVSRIESWESQPVSDGFAGLQKLADASFTGAVSTNGNWVLMLNGRVINVPEGQIERFDSASGTAYRAPHPSVPLLLAMRETGGTREGRYFTDDTPLKEVHETLSSGNFTGYVELSDNVLSGDYYICYYGGQSLSMARVGNAERLLTGEEAFDRARDEVGIYEVYSVDLTVTELPEPQTEEQPAASPAAQTDRSGDQSDSSTPSPTETPEQSAGSSESDPGAHAEAEPAKDREASESEPNQPRQQSSDSTPAAKPSSETHTADREHRESDETTETAEHDADPISEEAAWRKSKTIPALDPEESAELEPQTGETAGSSEDTTRESSTDRESTAVDATTEASTEPADPNRQTEELERLRDRLETAETDRDQLKQERDRLKARLKELQSQHTSQEPPDQRGKDITPDRALDGTDLFIRYQSRGEVTLQSAKEQNADRQTVTQNLRIEEHTRFDTEEATVNGQSFDSFIADRLEYRFVDWIARTLLFEIRDTGNQKSLSAIFQAIPEIDRAEFDGTVTTTIEEETISETFDIVIRNRMGEPLFLAQLNDQRDPATGGMMADLIERASAVAEGHETVAGVFLVTASFFEPEALETASEATGGGFLSRDAKESFVKLTRRAGYHLCLVEARQGEFHLAVPEI